MFCKYLFNLLFSSPDTPSESCCPVTHADGIRCGLSSILPSLLAHHGGCGRCMLSKIYPLNDTVLSGNFPIGRVIRVFLIIISNMRAVGSLYYCALPSYCSHSVCSYVMKCLPKSGKATFTKIGNN